MDVSASKAALLAACAYPFRAGTPWVEERGRSAIMGDDFHKRVAARVDSDRYPRTPYGRINNCAQACGEPVPDCQMCRGACPDAPVTTKWLRDRLAHADTWIAANRRDGWRAEVAYAYDPVTGVGRVLGYDIGREYEKHGKLPHEVAGSADIAWTVGDEVTIADWKTGRFVGDSVWAQMEWLCLLAARATGAWSARAIVLHATDHGIVQTERTYDDVALWRVAEQMRIDVNAIEDSWPVTGPWCDAQYCPARAGCSLYQLSKKETA